MFHARMRVYSIRLFVSMDTVSRRALVSVKMANEEDVLVDLSENVIEHKSTPKRKGDKVRTRRWNDEETDILIKAYEKIQEELDTSITEIKNKMIGLRSQLSREVA